MLETIELFFWGAGFILTYEGVSQKFQKKHHPNPIFIIVSGSTIVIAGALFWYGIEQASLRLAETQSIQPPQPTQFLQELETGVASLDQRREWSLAVARQAFRVGGEGAMVLSEDGRWIEFLPDVDDVKA